MERQVANPAPSVCAPSFGLALDGRLAWAVWGFQFLAGLAFVLYFGSNIPYRDEYELVPVLTGERPLTASWLWEQHNEHRIPLPKLFYVALGRLTQGHFRPVLVVNFILLGVLAAGLIIAARRLRGSGHFADAFFPLALLHWGHYEALLMPILIQYIASTALACVLLVLVARPQGPSGRSAVLAGLCLLALPLCGVNGLVYVPPLSLWLAYGGFLRWRSGVPTARRDGVRMAALSLAAALVVAFYWVDYHRPSNSTPFDLGTLVRTGLAFLGMAVGVAGIKAWPIPSVLVAGLALATAVLLLWAWRRAEGVERARPAGLLLFLAGLAAMTLGVASGRGDAFVSRYALLAAPLLCCTYLAWGIYGSPVWRRFLQVGLFLLMGIGLFFNVISGLHQGSLWKGKLDRLQTDARQGLPSPVLAARHTPAIYPRENILAQRLEMLRKAGMPPFQAPSAR